MRFLEIHKVESSTGYEWYLYISDDGGPLTGIRLDKAVVDKLINDISEAACHGAKWEVYEESQR